MSALQDPRVLFAAERTLLAWTRTSLSLQAFGFAIDRLGMALDQFAPLARPPLARPLSLLLGECFILLGAGCALYSVRQHRRVLRTLAPEEIPAGYLLRGGVVLNLLLVLLGGLVGGYLLHEYAWGGAAPPQPAGSG